jgi:hypothetical protein
MGAVFSTVDSTMRAELDDLRSKTSAKSEDARLSLEFDIDSTVARIVEGNPSDPQSEIKKEVRKIIDRWKNRL